MSARQPRVRRAMYARSDDIFDADVLLLLFRHGDAPLAGARGVLIDDAYAYDIWHVMRAAAEGCAEMAGTGRQPPAAEVPVLLKIVAR